MALVVPTFDTVRSDNVDTDEDMETEQEGNAKSEFNVGEVLHHDPDDQ